MKNEKIIALIEGYGAGTLTPEEEMIFFQWYSEAGLEEFHRLLSQCQRLPGNMTYYPPMPEAMRAKLEQDMQGFDPSGVSDGTMRIGSFRRSHWGWAAAAVLIILAAGGYWLFSGKRSADIAPVERQAKNNDAAPGKTRAMLTLADGSRITLDSAKTGQLAVQGKTTVTNQHGTVTYSAAVAPELLYNTLTTARGEQSPRLTLSDGTKVWLNAASSIRFPVAFTGSARNVEITGEAYFEVAKDKTKPFFVKAGGMDVQVLGTSFDINAYQDEPNMRTTLLEGSVKVLSPKSGQQDMVLLSGQQAQVGTKGISLVSDVDVDQVMAWKNGLFNFNHADLQSVLRQLARWYDIEVVFEGGAPARSFHGKITKDLNLSQVIQLLQEVEVKFRIEGKQLIVTQ